MSPQTVTLADVLAAEVLVAVLADENTLLLYGRTETPLPETAEVEFDGEDTAGGEFRAYNWAEEGAASDDPSCFVGVIRSMAFARMRPAGCVVVGGERRLRLSLPSIHGNPETFLATTKAHLRVFAGGLFEFLHVALGQPGNRPPSARAQRLLVALLHVIARHDGFVEVFGRIDGVGTFVQGWSFHLAGSCRSMLVEAEGLAPHSCLVGSFDREDLGGAARGIAGVVAGPHMLDPDTVRRVFFKTEDAWFYLDNYENRHLLADGTAIPHLKDMLPRLAGDAAVLRALKRVVNARFLGYDTVSQLEVPVRAAVDLAVSPEGVGIVLVGWLLDPLGLVAEVTLKGGAFAQPIDSGWARVARRDVTEAFIDNHLFAPHLSGHDHDHGFLAFLPDAAAHRAREPYYLEFGLRNGTIAFLPVGFTATPPNALMRHLLGSIDVHNPSAEQIVSGPFGAAVQAAARSAAGLPRVRAVHEFGRRGEGAGPAVILPLTLPRDDLDVNFAAFAVDPDLRAAEIIVVAGSNLPADVLPTVRRHALFYRLRIRFVEVAGPIDRFQALEIGASIAGSDQVLFLTPAILPKRPGWLSALVRAADTAGGPCLVSPTLLYEDDSIKFAGFRNNFRRGGVVDTALVSRFAGYPRDWLTRHDIAAGKPKPAYAVTTDCCLVPRRSFAELDGFSKEYLGPELKGLDFCLRARAAGVQALWAPAVEMVAVDEPWQPEGNDWPPASALVDRWGFHRRWALYLSNTGAEA